MKQKFLFILFLFPLIALADRVTIKTKADYTATTTAGTALAQNKNRKGLIISNKGVDNILVQFGTSSAIAEGMDIDNGVTVQFTHVPMDAVIIGARASTGANPIGVLEFE